MTTYLSPSTINFLHAHRDSGLARTSDVDIMKISRNIVEHRDFPKLQVVEKEGHWFALNDSQLELCRRLESDGKCSSVRVDIVPISDVPTELRKMMVAPEDKEEKSSEDSSATSRSTSRGYQKLTQGDPKPHDGSSGSDDENSESSSDSEFDDSDSECDWSDDVQGSSEVDSSDEDKSTEDERECLL